MKPHASWRAAVWANPRRNTKFELEWTAGRETDSSDDAARLDRTGDMIMVTQGQSQEPEQQNWSFDG